jgi:hypothetical protein
MEQIARAGVGSDRVTVTNASGVSSGSMAEWVVGRLPRCGGFVQCSYADLELERRL